MRIVRAGGHDQGLGVGINTLPHAIRELAGLGLLQKLDDVAIRTDILYYLNRHGQEVWRDPRGLVPATTSRNASKAGFATVPGPGLAAVRA